MHEYSIVAALVDRVRREVEAHPGAIARRLRVRIGELAGVEPELLRTAFAVLRERGACAGAELDIEQVAAAWCCTRCDLPVAPGAVLRCPSCGRPAGLAAGGEIILERIEMEVRDV
jgi:hydrogenase nickel incorporation protein HypA/HybF